MDVEQQQVVVPVVFGISLSYGGLLRMPSLADCESGLPRMQARHLVVPLAPNEHDVVVVDGVSDASSEVRPTAPSLIDWHVSIAWRRDARDL
ncbi:hypothetical protein HZH68_011351 [Vespula germanica]|uniref:Uncharacterized protein n=1 Tax=Vespula germanica TaxID=30212 RepID=A0A834JNB3_VESGE|nr:hypothetical protein HZH68_011351 [Vespula germanica]